jgi:hypothetical protein
MESIMINRIQGSTPYTQLSHSPTIPRLLDTRIALNYDPYVVLKAGRIGAANNQKVAGQVNHHQLKTGIDEAMRYVHEFMDGGGILANILDGIFKKKRPKRTDATDKICNDIYNLYYETSTSLNVYTPKQMSDAWNEMNRLVVLLYKQELASK